MVDVVVVSAPAASPATDAGTCAVVTRRAISVPTTPSVTAICSATSGSARSTTTPANAPGAANSSIVTAERLSGRGVRSLGQRA